MAAVRGGRRFFRAGQVALDANGAVVGPGDSRARTEPVLRNRRAVLEAAGGTF